MKCTECNGTGKSKYGYNQPCTQCYGKGIVEPLTEQEWLQTADTEQLADVIADFYLLGYTHGHNQMDITSRTKWFEWLKQLHKE